MGREYAERPIAAVGAVVVRNDGRILLTRRANPPLQGLWSTPGGVLELGETIAECARREVLEESGVECAPTDVYHAVDSIHRDSEGRVRYHYLIVDVLARWISGEARPGTDASDVGWFTLDDLADLATTPQLHHVASDLLIRASPPIGGSG